MNRSLEALFAAIGIGIKSDTAVQRIITDSRDVRAGDIYVAIVGTKNDGHFFIDDAVRRGAVAVVAQKGYDIQELGIPIAIVPDTHSAYAILCRALFDKPDRKLFIIGITGTNGKSSITYILKKIFEAAEKPTGIIGTLGYVIGDNSITLPFTTPTSFQLYSILSKMNDENIRVVAMEVSSHGLHQSRALGIEYDVAVFTNLTQDHLDYHGNMEDYFTAKCLLFRQLEPSKPSVINADDPYGARLIKILGKRPIMKYGLESDNLDLTASSVKSDVGSLIFTLETPDGKIPVRMPITGRFNLYNALAAAGAAMAHGIGLSDIARGLSLFRGIKGRFERIEGEQPFTVLIDYAHTPDALYSALAAAREITAGRLIVVFGAGGDRDRSKRPKMGAVASELADEVIVTSDNPRTENPEKIMDMIEEGIPKGYKHNRIGNRIDAIRHSLDIARRGDTVLIAGKGHEDYQIIGTTKHHLDDAEEVRKWLDERGYL